MAFLSNILSISPPKGFWEIIIRAFEGFAGSYILAVILLTVIIKIVWSPLDLYNRRIAQKNALQQEKMKPELDRIRAKYGHDQQLLNQKTNELYKKYNFNLMGSCGFMIIYMALNLLVFFTLFAGLNNMAAYKITTNYTNLKEVYSNCLVLTDKYITENQDTYKETFKDYENLKFVIKTEGENKQIVLMQGESEISSKQYVNIDDFAVKSENSEESLSTEQVVAGYVAKYITTDSDEVLIEQSENVKELKLSQAITYAIMPKIESEYTATKDNFLWIDNIWVADSPFNKSIFTYKQYTQQARIKGSAEEKLIYNAFMPELSRRKARANGYIILPILCIAVSILSMWLSNRLNNKGKNGQVQMATGGKVMMFVMPVIFGLFALFYTSVFAFYMLVGQLVSMALLPLQNLILNAIQNKKDKKEEQKKFEEVSYRRKDK